MPHEESSHSISIAVLLALLAAVGIMNAIGQKKDSPPVRIMEDTSSDEIILSQSAKIDELEQKIAQQEFDYAAIKAERDALEQKSAALEDQIRYLRDRNNSLKESETNLQSELDAIGEKLAQLSKEREENDEAYQAALSQIEEYQAQMAVTQAELEAAKTSISRTAEEGKVSSSLKLSPQGQSRNIIGVKGGESDIDIEAVFALAPHWFLILDAGIVGTPSDYIREEFPGLEADHEFMYTTLFGTGLNWRIESISLQPNFYIATMLGPAWYKYVNEYDDEEGINTHMLWRSSIGFDLVLYKNLQFTTDISLDYINKYELTPRVTVGLQWNFSNSWSALEIK